MNPNRIYADIAYDEWGQMVTLEKADQLLEAEQGRRLLSPYHDNDKCYWNRP